MILKVIATISVLSVCASNSLLSLQDASSKLVSAESLNRIDVPSSYKFNSAHGCTTVKPKMKEIEPHQFYPPETPPPVFKPRYVYPTIQYAPLTVPLYTKMKKKQETPFNINYFTPDNTPDKDHLEPIIPPPKKAELVIQGLSLSNLNYIPGKKIRVMQTVSHIPAHNAVYKSYKYNTPRVERPNKVNYLRQYMMQRTPADRVTPSILKDTESGPVSADAQKFTMMPFLKPHPCETINSNQYIPDKPNEMENSLIGYKSPQQKINSLYLNVARQYNFVPALHTGANPAMFVKPLIRVPDTSKLESVAPGKRTIVYPIQKKKHFSTKEYS